MTNSLPSPLREHPPRVARVPANHGVDWITQAWELFKRSPWILILNWLILMLLSMAAGIIPLGSLLITPLLMGSYIASLRKIKQQQPLSVSDLFSGLKNHATPLLLLGGLSIIAVGILILIGAVFFGLGLGSMEQRSGTLMIIGLVVFLPLGLFLTLLLMVAMWFAPSLVILNDLRPATAIRLALTAMNKNFIAFFVFGILLILLHIAATIPLGLGLIVVGPLTLVMAYTSYQDIFNNEQTADD